MFSASRITSGDVGKSCVAEMCGPMFLEGVEVGGRIAKIDGGNGAHWLMRGTSALRWNECLELLDQTRLPRDIVYSSLQHRFRCRRESRR